ncbi:MAG: hypothetical protein DHS20C13_26270 [Thermodesulfobacteriota bacterium]|nr:MAG: hypothetical protein DHS20C13_26270 [Thermodesulfobacteriota bacterium]
MKILIFIFALVFALTLNVMSLPQIDEDSITDEKKFLADNSQCIAHARSGQSGGGNDFVKDAAIGSATGAGSSVVFGAMTGGDIGTGAALGAVVGGLSGGSGSVYRTSQPNSQIYSQCMTERGYKILKRE